MFYNLCIMQVSEGKAASESVHCVIVLCAVKLLRISVAEQLLLSYTTSWATLSSSMANPSSIQYFLYNIHSTLYYSLEGVAHHMCCFCKHRIALQKPALFNSSKVESDRKKKLMDLIFILKSNLGRRISIYRQLSESVYILWRLL